MSTSGCLGAAAVVRLCGVDRFRPGFLARPALSFVPLCGSCLVLLRTDSGWEFDWGGTSVKR